MFMVIVTVKSYRHLEGASTLHSEYQVFSTSETRRQFLKKWTDRVLIQREESMQSNDKYLIQETQCGINIHPQKYWKSMQISFFYSAFTVQAL